MIAAISTDVIDLVAVLRARIVKAIAEDPDNLSLIIEWDGERYLWSSSLGMLLNVNNPNDYIEVKL